MRLLIAGGGTGGHLYPGVAIAEELLKRGGHEVLFAGSSQGIEARVLPKLGLPFQAVRCGALVGKGLLGKARSLGMVLAGIMDAGKVIKTYRPDACLGVGGYASFPVAAAARLRGVFTAIQEQNATPGLANRVLAKLAQRIYAGDEAAAGQFPADKTTVTGTPIRLSFSGTFSYEPPADGKPVRVLVLGGSQGAASLNREVPKILATLGLPLEIRHQAGKNREAEVASVYQGMAGARVEGFIEDMPAAYKWAQIVIARAGASTVSELAAAGRPAIMIPYPHAAANHQEANARAAQKRGAALCILDSALGSEELSSTLRKWIKNPSIPASMAEAALRSAKRDAAARIVDDLLLLAGGSAQHV